MMLRSGWVAGLVAIVVAVAVALLLLQQSREDHEVESEPGIEAVRVADRKLVVTVPGVTLEDALAAFGDTRAVSFAVQRCVEARKRERAFQFSSDPVELGQQLRKMEAEADPDFIECYSETVLRLQTKGMNVDGMSISWEPLPR